MSAIIVRFPDGTREFRLTDTPLEEGDVIWHDGLRYRVLKVATDEQDRPVVIVEPETDGLGDLLRSEEGAIVLVPAD